MTDRPESETVRESALESFDLWSLLRLSSRPELLERGEEARLDFELGIREADDLESWGR
jgi:hypothetical protein